MLELVDEESAGSCARHRYPPFAAPRMGVALERAQRTELDRTFRLGNKARPNMNAHNIVTNDTRRNVLRLSATAFTQCGTGYPAEPLEDLAAVRELRV